MKYILHAFTAVLILSKSFAADGGQYNKEEPFPDPQHPGKTVIATSNLCGLGGVINKVDGKCVIIKIFPHSAAEKAKLQLRDEILKVADKDTSNFDLETITKQIRGEPNTTVALTIFRKGVANPFEVTITRIPFEIHEGD